MFGCLPELGTTDCVHDCQGTARSSRDQTNYHIDRLAALHSPTNVEALIGTSRIRDCDPLPACNRASLYRLVMGAAQ